MHRIDGAGNDNNQFTEGNPGTGTPATTVTDDWLNAVQEEIAHVIEGAGTALDKEDNTQLLAAIQALILAGTPTIDGDRVYVTGVTFAAGTQNNDAVYWDSASSKFDQAVADGTEKQNMVGFADVTNGEVTLYGNLDTLSGMTPGRYYLSGDTAGAITQTAPVRAVKVGLAKSATDMFVDIDAEPIETLIETLPIYPEIQTADNRLAITDNGASITVNSAQAWLMRGVDVYNTSDIASGDRTFAYAASKTYHLRWNKADGFTLNDLSDSAYNPGAVAESNSGFDSTYDDMLIARVVTDSGDTATITKLTNAATLKTNIDIDTAIVDGIGSPYNVTLNWSRRPVSVPALRGLKNTYQEFGAGVEASGSTMREVAIDDGGTDNRYGASLTSYYNDTIGNSGRVWITWLLEA